MKFYNIELFLTPAQKLAEYLNKNNIYYELSKVAGLNHFEILLNDKTLKKVNNFFEQCNFKK